MADKTYNSGEASMPQKSEMSDATGKKNLTNSSSFGEGSDAEARAKDAIKLNDKSTCVLDDSDASFDDDSGY